MKYSLTTSGIIVAVAGTLLVRFGFSEACANEMIANGPLLIGGLMAWIGRVKAGGVTWLGVKE